MKELSKGYGWPKQGAEAELESLCWHAQQREGLRTDAPTESVSSRMIEEASQWLGVKWKVPNDFDEKEAFLRAVKKLDWTSSPGVPYCYSNPTNGDMFGVVEGEPNMMKVEEVWQMVRQRMFDGTCDPIRLFVKPEPHKQKKIDRKQWRLISSVSVVDQLIDHMLFGEINDQLVKNWFETPMKIGWTPFKGGYKLVPKGKVLAVDKSSWDWTVQAWLVEQVMRLRKALADASSPRYKDWVKLVEWRYSCLFDRPILQLSNGVQIRQEWVGCMKSGCVNTITDNSMDQLLLHLRICIELDIPIGWFWALGDDTLQGIPQKVVEYMRSLRQFCIVKQAIAKAEFAGFDFSGSTVEPMYRGKHAYTILHADERYIDDFKRAYKLLYFKSRYYPEVQPFLEKSKLGDVGAAAIWEGTD